MKYEHIDEYTTAKGLAFRVRVNGKSKSFGTWNYRNKTEALKDAKRYRDSLLLSNVKRDYRLSELLGMSYELHPVRAETKRKQMIMYRKYINMDRFISDVTKADISRTLAAMVEDKSDDTIGRVLSIWKRIYDTAIDMECVDRNLAQSVKAPQSMLIQAKKKNLIVTREEILKIEEIVGNAIQHPVEKLMYVSLLEFLWFTGLRPSEALALTKEDVDDSVHVTKAVGSSIEEKFTIRKTKTAKSVRDVPIADELKPIVDELKRLDYGFLFVDRYGCMMNSTKVGDRLYQILRPHGIEFNLYMLRHSFSQRLMDSGANSKTHQELMGHTSFNATVSMYGQSSSEQKRKAIQESNVMDLSKVQKTQ